MPHELTCPVFGRISWAPKRVGWTVVAWFLLLSTAACAREDAGNPRLLKHSYQLSQVAVSPDGKHIVSGGSLNKTITVWDADTGKRVGEIVDEPGTVDALAFSPDSRYFAVARGAVGGQSLQVYDAQTLELWKSFNPRGPVPAIAFSPDGTLLAAAMRRQVELWEVASSKEVRTLGSHRWSITAIAFSPAGDRLVAGGLLDDSLTLWDITVDRPVAQFGTGAEGWTAALAYSLDGQEVVVAFNRPRRKRGKEQGTHEPTVQTWLLDRHSRRWVQPLRGPGWIRSVAFRPGGAVIAAGGGWGLSLLGADSGGVRQELRNEKQKEILAVAVESRGKWIAAAGGKYVSIWPLDGVAALPLPNVAPDTAESHTRVDEAEGPRLLPTETELIGSMKAACSTTDADLAALCEVVKSRFPKAGNEYIQIDDSIYLVTVRNTGRVGQGIYLVNTRSRAMKMFGGFGIVHFGRVSVIDGDVKQIEVSYLSAMRHGKTGGSDYILNIRLNPITGKKYVIEQKISDMVNVSEELASTCEDDQAKLDPGLDDICNRMEELGKVLPSQNTPLFIMKKALDKEFTNRLIQSHDLALRSHQAIKGGDRSSKQPFRILEDGGVWAIVDHKPRAMSLHRYINILNDYAFFAFKYGEGRSDLSIDILARVIKMDPNRSPAYLNMVDALSHAIQYQTVPQDDHAVELMNNELSRCQAIYKQKTESR